MNNTTDFPLFEDPKINVWGIVSIAIFYVVILLIGLYASWKSNTLKDNDSEDLMVAGRSIGMFVGIFTMTATWVGGGYINGTAEAVFTPGSGLVWAQAPIGYGISLFLGGFLFAEKMRQEKYVTMLDPFDHKYGSVMAGFLYIPALLGEIFWSAAILSALGASLTVILHLTQTISVIVSACIAVFYTLIGGLYSVAYTDVVQLCCIFVGLWLGVGFSLNHDAVVPLSETKWEWLGTLTIDPSIGLYIDSYLLLIFGGIPWQVYFQRVLSAKTPKRAQILSFSAAFGCIFMAIPAVMIGAIGASAKWNETDYARYYPTPIPESNYGLILPLVLQYLCPTAVAVIGLGAVSAAVMSSADSSVLSAASMFARNIYAPLRNAISKSAASEREIIWIMRLGILLVGALATVIAITVNSIYGLWYLCGDAVYVILFPQLLCVIHFPWANTYGAVVGFVVGLLLRLLGGEPLLGLPAAIHFPYYTCDINGDCTQNFPFKTLCMLLSLFCIISVSSLTHWLFTKKISTKYDFLKVFNIYEVNKDIPMKSKHQENGKANAAYLPDSAFN